ncbi:FUSC family protein [Microbacteriaceae bacterium VKM Ac-2855]|nr:FUSC family protein [Microbacteriaceae bacterium VKM Ac-2855]
MAIPLVILWAVGRTDLTLYATFGAFASLYGRNHTHLPRLRMQATAAAYLVTMVTIGTAVAVSPAREWLVIPVVAVCAAIASLLSDALHWHPPGPLFTVFALAACASVPTAATQIPVALGLAAGSAALAMLIGLVGYAHPRARRLPPTPWRTAFTISPASRATAVRFGAVVLVTGLIPTITGLGHPYWAMVAGVAAVSGADTTARLVRAGHRILGTVVGIGVAAAILLLDLPSLATIAVAVALQMLAELFVGRNYGLTLAFVTPLAILMVELAHHVDESVLLRDRLVETALGVAVGLVFVLLAHRRTGRIQA